MSDGQLTEQDLERMTPEQIAELQKQNCLFCHINNGKIPAKKIYDDDLCFAILDINPATKGHVLLLPKEHYLLLPQVPEETIKHLARVAKKISKSAIRSLGSEGTNIFIANGLIAGQKAPHLIIHIIPRVSEDRISCFDLPEKSIPNKDLENMQKKLLEKLGTKIEKKTTIEKKETEKIGIDEFKELIK